MEKKFKISAGEIEYNCIIKKKKKKSITISVEHGTGIVVTIPFSVKYERALEIINQKIDWIEANLKRAEQNKKEIEKIEKKFESKILFCGREYEVEIIDNSVKKELEIENGKIKIYNKNGEKTGKLKKWYVAQGKELIQERHNYYEKITGFKALDVKFRQMTNWGICSSKKRITYNIKLASAPVDVIDYVVLHEICHLKHLNHSKDFWSEVEKYMADFKNRKEWLRKNSSYIELTLKKISDL